MWKRNFIAQLKETATVVFNHTFNPTAKLIGQLLAVEELMLAEIRELKQSLPYSNTRKNIEVIIEVTEQMIRFAKTNETSFLPIRQLLQHYLYDAHRMSIRYEETIRSADPEEPAGYTLQQLEAEIDRLKTGYVSEYRSLFRAKPEEAEA